MDKKYDEFYKNIKNFLRDKLSGDDLRKFCYVALENSECYNVLLEEYMFYINLNDLDKEFNFNYKKNLNKKLEDTKNKIVLSDKKIIKKYMMITIIFSIFFLFLLILVLRIIYR